MKEDSHKDSASGVEGSEDVRGGEDHIWLARIHRSHRSHS